MSIRNLDRLFRPRSVALIGASRRPYSVGNVIARNLLRGGFDGPVMPVNPKTPVVESVLTFPDVESLPETPDLAIVSTPPQTVPGLIDALGKRGTKAAVVITAGFGELGAEGKALERRMLEAAKPHTLRIVGPNCVGMMVPGLKLNASFAHADPAPGDVAFLSQSGAILTSVLDWAAPRRIGFSHMVSMGGMADVDFGDMLDYLARDGGTRAILLYMESVTNARKFMSAARAAARLKPVVVIKAGRHEAAAKAASSHTGALAGSDTVYDAAVRRAGMLRVLDLEHLFDAVETLSRRPAIRGDRLAIVTNGGGMGVLATDRLLDQGGRLATLSEETIEKLNAVLPATWSHGNPVDIIGDAPGSRYAGAIDAVLEDKGVDALLVLNCPVAVADGREAAEATLVKAKERRKPFFTSWVGEGAAREARAMFAANGIPSYETPGQAVRGFMDLVHYRQNQEVLMEIPGHPASVPASARDEAAELIRKAVDEGREWLSEVEAKRVLKVYGVPVVETDVAETPEAAAEKAEELGLPAALKILSPDITHKTDVGGVALNLRDREAVRRAAEEMLETIRTRQPEARIDGFSVQPMAKRPGAHELILGLVDDATFGPVVLFGRGGTAVEVIRDKAIALPPLNRTLAHGLIQRTRVARLMAGYRGRPAADFEAVADTLMKIAEIAADHAGICDLDINPLWADQHGVLALDARIRVRAAEGRGADRFAILPYPKELETRVEDRQGATYLLRPIRPEDAPGIQKTVQMCDPEDIRMRFFSALRDMPVKLAARLTQIDYDREMAFVAAEPAAAPFAEQEIVGVVRLAMDPDRTRGEYSVIVRTDHKGRGLGYKLMQAIVDFGRAQGLSEIYGDVLRENKPMLDMCGDLGFHRRAAEGDGSVVEVYLPL